MATNPFWWLKYATLSPEAMSKAGLSQEEAAEMIARFKREFPEVLEWAEKAASAVGDADSLALLASFEDKLLEDHIAWFKNAARGEREAYLQERVNRASPEAYVVYRRFCEARGIKPREQHKGRLSATWYCSDCGEMFKVPVLAPGRHQMTGEMLTHEANHKEGNDHWRRPGAPRFGSSFCWIVIMGDQASGGQEVK